jgi:hypothetical protein
VYKGPGTVGASFVCITADGQLWPDPVRLRFWGIELFVTRTSCFTETYDEQDQDGDAADDGDEDVGEHQAAASTGS